MKFCCICNSETHKSFENNMSVKFFRMTRFIPLLEKILLILIIITISSSLLIAQAILHIEGTTVSNSITGYWGGYNVARNVPTILTYQNNTITSVNTSGYMLQAGDEQITSTNSNLDGSFIAGNKFVWNGTDLSSTTHAVFTGYNLNVIIKYNYLFQTPFGILRKSNGMTNTSGGVAYNIIINPMVGIVAKGINNVNVFNNTLYSNKTTSETTRGLIDIYTNTDNGKHCRTFRKPHIAEQADGLHLLQNRESYSLLP